MIDIVQTPKKAIELRRAGNSYADISRQLKVSKTSVSNWVKNVRLTETEKLVLQKSLTNKVQRGRMKAAISLRSRTVFKEKKAFEDAEKSFKKFIKQPLFSTGLGLYWAKGSLQGGTIQFMSSNRDMIRVILLWMDTYLDLPEKSFKMKQNKASVGMTASRIEALRTLIAWQKLMIRYHS